MPITWINLAGLDKRFKLGAVDVEFPTKLPPRPQEERHELQSGRFSAAAGADQLAIGDP